MRIKDVSKKAPRIANTSRLTPKVDPEEVRQALNAEYFDLDDEEQRESLRRHHLQSKAAMPWTKKT